jgi:ABC-2 type transport system permease protein
VTVLGTAVVLSAGGLGLGVGFAMVTGDGGAVDDYLLASLPYFAPMLLLGALALTLHGLLPRRTVLAWAALAFCAVVVVFAEALRFPGWLRGISPFDELALTPSEDLAWTPVLVVAALALALGAAGLLAFRRRDVVAA